MSMVEFLAKTVDGLKPLTIFLSKFFFEPNGWSSRLECFSDIENGNTDKNFP